MGNVTEIIIHAEGPEGLLEGSYIAAKNKKTPTVIIIPGSGHTDRDGNSPNGLTASTYFHLTHGLAEFGVGSLRIDKRGMFGSHGAIPNPNDVKIEDYVQDIGKWIEVLKSKFDVGSIWLLGHSEGGLVAMLASQLNKEIIGVTLVATPAENIAEVLKRQLKDNPANQDILQDAFSMIKSLQLGKCAQVDGIHPALQALFHPDVQEYLIDWMTYNPLEIVSKIQ